MKKVLLSVAIITALGVGSIASAGQPVSSAKSSKVGTTIAAPVIHKEEVKKDNIKTKKQTKKEQVKEEKQKVK